MPSERFYVDAPLEGSIELSGAELHHLAHVLRVREEETVELINGKGVLAQAKVGKILKQKAFLQILSVNKTPLHPPRLLLTVPLMRPSKLELVIEKGTELGADIFWFYQADHSEKSHISEHQMERLLYTAVSAMKQCGRLDLPKIELRSLSDVLQEEGPIFFGDTREGGERVSNHPRAIFITGPERGFSKKELEKLERTAKAVRIHHNILRAETAPLAIASIFFA